MIDVLRNTCMFVSVWSFFPIMCLIIAVFQDEPFTSNEPETIFNMAKFLLHTLVPDVPNGISKVYPCHRSAVVKVGWEQMQITVPPTCPACLFAPFILGCIVPYQHRWLTTIRGCQLLMVWLSG